MSGEPKIADAVLWVDHPKSMLERACGLAVVERQLFVLARAGIKRVWVAAHRPVEADRLRLPPRLEVQWIARDGDGPVECRPPYIGFSGDHFVKQGALEEILAGTYTEHVSFQDDDKKGVVQIIPYRGERVVQFERRAMPAGSYARVGDRASTTAWLLDTARKGHDGLMARVFDRHISLRVTRWLLDTPVKPNHMTVFSSLLGSAGALEFAQPGQGHAIAGALIVWLHSVLDGCDGELARLRYQESRFGGVLDFWGDNVVHVLLFTCLGLGLYRAGGGAWTLVLGLLAAAASLASAAVTFRISTRKEDSGPLFKGIALEPAPTGTERALQRVEDFLTQRDFIYLLILAAVFGKQQLFLIAAGIGSPLFLLVLLYLTAQGDARQAVEPPKRPPTLTATRGSNT